MNISAVIVKGQLLALVVKFKGPGLCISEYRRMVRKAQVLASFTGMDSGELLGEMIAA